ncbi:MAG: nitrous oxide-stimulated promoter family protein [Chitinispirillaceae bacterium]|nr:nitrous oxide-stimulated promoter family protein [Chitinispirillaceae bacterium]
MTRSAREKKTVEAMISLYCHDHHHPRTGLCAECTGLFAYAGARVDACAFGESKPVCRNCRVHCYKPEMRERIRTVMRYAGPRLLWKHPVLSVLHLLDSMMRPGVNTRRGG